MTRTEFIAVTMVAAAISIVLGWILQNINVPAFVRYAILLFILIIGLALMYTR